jgi:5-(carboxyamino)imidazole ribonucleotide synthase
MPVITPPGSTVGLLGGGQLGRMFGIAARRMGYRVHTYEPAPDSPAGQISDREFTGSYQDRDLLKEFVASVDVITFEFENIPAALVEELALQRPVFPRAEVLHICQNRAREKSFLQAGHYPHVPFALVETPAELDFAFERIGLPAVLKTADFGYDGKGQVKVTPENRSEVLQAFSGPAILEAWIDFDRELSVVCARDQRGRALPFPVAENHHARHILDHTIAPGRFAPQIISQALEITEAIIHDLDVVGLLAVEYFLTKDGRLLVNELAPRPHNSGHFTFDACVTSQFEQQLRAVCGLPFGSPALRCPAVMVNLLGDLWIEGRMPDWYPVLSEPNTKFHLYGKSEGRPGRKMGHFCVLDDNIETAVSTALRIKRELHDAHSALAASSV